MSEIKCIYERKDEPNFPATDQHPDAVRYRVGKYWVDAVGGEPSQAEVGAVLNPPKPPDDPRTLPGAGPVTRAEFEGFKSFVLEKYGRPN